jgi:hypothetical protein
MPDGVAGVFQTVRYGVHFSGPRLAPPLDPTADDERSS